MRGWFEASGIRRQAAGMRDVVVIDVLVKR